jgi:hypothetical protein
MSLTTPKEFPQVSTTRGPTMTPRAKQNIRNISFTVSGAALLSALVWATPKAQTMLDATYVRRDTFTVYQASIAARDSAFLGRARLDSVALAYELRELRQLIRSCAKHPDTC